MPRRRIHALRVGTAAATALALGACSTLQERLPGMPDSSQSPEAQQPQTQGNSERSGPQTQPSQPQQANPNSQPQSNATQAATEVSEQELDKFAKAVQTLRKQRAQSQQKMAKALKEVGLTPKQFQDLNRSASGQDGSQSLSQQEQQHLDRARQKLKSMQESMRAQQKQAIQEAGLEPKRFQQISQAVQQDPELRQKLRQKLQG